MTGVSERLQRHVQLLHGEPVVRLTGDRAIQQAYELRRLGLSYHAVAVVMGRYHGEYYSGESWRLRVRSLGAEPRPRGSSVKAGAR